MLQGRARAEAEAEVELPLVPRQVQHEGEAGGRCPDLNELRLTSLGYYLVNINLLLGYGEL